MHSYEKNAARDNHRDKQSFNRGLSDGVGKRKFYRKFNGQESRATVVFRATNDSIGVQEVSMP